MVQKALEVGLDGLEILQRLVRLQERAGMALHALQARHYCMQAGCFSSTSPFPNRPPTTLPNFLALQVLPQDERVSICAELTESTLRCVRDQNGNHVVQVRDSCWTNEQWVGI